MKQAATPDREGQQSDSLEGCDWGHSGYLGEPAVLPLLPMGGNFFDPAPFRDSKDKTR
jgi:hypothetical protein